MGKRRIRSLPMLLPCILAACSQAPAYRPPDMALPASYHDGDAVWGKARPSTPPLANSWWTALDDPMLDRLEEHLESDSPELAVALARHGLALSALRESSAARLPESRLGATISRNRQSDTRPLRGANQPDTYDADTAGAGLSYEVDLWARVGDGIRAARARAEASADGTRSVRLALQCDLASTWVALRGADKDLAILADAVAVFQRAASVTRHRFDGGIANGIDLGRADAQLADAQAQYASAQAKRARLLHAVEALAGIPAGTTVIPPSLVPLHDLPIAPSLPSTLLQQRPDIASAERAMFAANRAIGVAQAARFPMIQLGGSGGFQSTAIAGLLSAPNAFWALGPQVVLPLFDGGRRRARVAASRAEWDIATGRYRATVLLAMRETEDALSNLAELRQEEDAQARAAAAATQASRLAYERYIKGANTLLDVVTAQTSELAARRASAQVATRRVQASIALLRALGGATEKT